MFLLLTNNLLEITVKLDIMYKISCSLKRSFFIILILFVIKIHFMYTYNEPIQTYKLM